MARTRQNGEGSVYRRASDGMWIGSITIGWEGDKRIRKTVSAKTGTGVREKLRVVQAKIDAGLPRGDDKLTRAAQAIEAALDRVIAKKEWRTPDMGGPLGTDAFGQRVAKAVEG